MKTSPFRRRKILITSQTKIDTARAFLDRAVFALLLALVALTAVAYGAVDPWWEGAFEGAAFALGALWVVEGALGGRWLVAGHRMLVPLAALCLFVFAQAVPFGGASVAGVEAARTLSADPAETLRCGLKLSALTLCCALLLRYASGERRLRALAFTLVGVGVLSAFFGLVRQTTHGEAVRVLAPRLAANVDGYAQFFNRNHFAFFAEMALGVALGLALGARRERRLFHAALALPLGAALVLSNSRGGVLGLCALSMMAALLYFASVRRAGREEAAGRGGAVRRRATGSLIFRGALIGVLLVAVPAGGAWLGGERLASRLAAVPVELGAAPSTVRWGDRRTEIWAATLGVVREHPLAGVGFGAYRAAVTAHHDASGEMSLEQAHNDYLELAASGGLVGVALAAWFAWLFLRHARASLKGRGLARRALAAGALAGVAAVALHSLFDFGLHVTANALTLAALATIATQKVMSDE